MHCIINLVFIVLRVRDGTESKYPSVVFLSIVYYIWRCIKPVFGVSDIARLKPVSSATMTS